jgi:hypothetical protein
MNEDFLENEDSGGDVGGILQRFKRQRRQPNPSGPSLFPMRPKLGMPAQCGASVPPPKRMQRQPG